MYEAIMDWVVVSAPHRYIVFSKTRGLLDFHCREKAAFRALKRRLAQGIPDAGVYVWDDEGDYPEWEPVEDEGHDPGTEGKRSRSDNRG